MARYKGLLGLMVVICSGPLGWSGVAVGSPHAPASASGGGGTIPVGSDPSALVVDQATHTMYVSNSGDGTVSVVNTKKCDTASLAKCSSADVGSISVGGNPSGLAMDQATDTLYVIQAVENQVAVVNGATCNATHLSACEVAGDVNVGLDPSAMVDDSATHTLYVANSGAGTVSVVNTAHCDGSDVTGCGQTPPTSAAGSAPDALSLDGTTGTLYVGDSGSDDLWVLATAKCKASNTSGCAANPVSEVDVGGNATSLADNPATKTIYVVTQGTSSIAVVDTSACNATTTSGCSQTPASFTGLGAENTGIAIDPINDVIYFVVSDFYRGEFVEAFNGATCNATTTSGCAGEPSTIGSGSSLGSILADPGAYTGYTIGTGSTVQAVSPPGQWSLQPTEIDLAGQLTSVSCPDSSFCVAVDTNANAVVMSHGVWSAPQGIALSGLDGVSCASQSFCMAVDNQGYAWQYAHGTWSASGTLGETAAGISCPTASFCVAVGSGGKATIYRGGSWKAATTVDPSRALTAVSCPSASYCVAVDNGGSAVFLQGKTWSGPVTIDPNGSLTSVSCVPGGETCDAVDSLGYGVSGYAQSWGTPTYLNAPLEGVSCTTLTCQAVGGSDVVTDDQGWRSPVALSGSPSMQAVSCTSVTFCAAVGGNDVAMLGTTSANDFARCPSDPATNGAFQFDATDAPPQGTSPSAPFTGISATISQAPSCVLTANAGTNTWSGTPFSAWVMLVDPSGFPWIQAGIWHHVNGTNAPDEAFAEFAWPNFPEQIPGGAYTGHTKHFGKVSIHYEDGNANGTDEPGLTLTFSNPVPDGEFGIIATPGAINGDPQCAGDPSNDSTSDDIQGDPDNSELFEVTYNSACMWDFFVPNDVAAAFTIAHLATEIDNPAGHAAGIYGQPTTFSNVLLQGGPNNATWGFHQPGIGCHSLTNDSPFGTIFATWAANYAGSCGP